MEVEPKKQIKDNATGKEVEDEQKVKIGREERESLGEKSVFVSIKSINISGSNPDLRRVGELTVESSQGNYNTSERDKLGSKFNIPDIKSETRVVVPRVCSDSHIGEGEGFHSSRLSSSASHGSLSSALLAVGITSSNSNSKNPLTSIPPSEEGGKECECDSETKKKEKSIATTTDKSKDIIDNSGLEQSVSVVDDYDDGVSPTREKVVADLEVFLDSVQIEDVEDTDLSIQEALHGLSLVNTTEDLLDDEELLEEYDEPDDELHCELEKVFDSELLNSVGSSSPKACKFRDSATWTQEDDMPSPLSDQSPVQSPRKSSGKSNRGHQQPQFDHQFQYHQQQHQYYRDRENRHHHNQALNSSSSVGSVGVGVGSSRNSRSHHRGSRGIHQSQSNQRTSGNSSVGEFIHHQPQQHHQPTECFTVSSQLSERLTRLYENVPTTQGGLESLEILLSGENCNYPTSGGSAGASNTSKASSSQTKSSINSSKNNGGSNSNHNLLLHHHHHSANNLNLAPSPTTGSSVEQLFSVSELLGPGSCLAVGGPPSRTSWVDSGRESLSFDGENNNSGGSTRNLLLIPPPPPPPLNYQGFTSNSIIMHQQKQLIQSPSHSQGHGQSSRKTGSRREKLVRQKQAIDETFLPIPTNSDKLGIEIGGNGGGYLAVPSPRRGVIPGNVIASNFITAAASPISLQRHPPASQIMLQENKKNRPLIPCDSPYGIMSSGLGTGGMGDWTYRSDKKGSQMTRDLLRCRSPQRGRTKGRGPNQSFDYGELPSHQMFPKRHLLTSRQLSSHHQGYPSDILGGGGGGGSNGTNNGANGSNSNGNPPFLLHPNQNHRSFPAGLFSGMSPKSCSMGDLTSSTTCSPNNHSNNNHNYQSYHGNGKPLDQPIICSNTNPPGGMSSNIPLVGSLPLPPSASVTYEFSLAPQSGTLAPGWHLTAVQRGLATAVPLAAAVARRRLPRPRTSRPRFGFTDKNEARRAKWTIVVTALALLAMSMLLVGITLRLAPLIDDLGSSPTLSNLSPTKICLVDPYTRRASGSSSFVHNEYEHSPKTTRSKDCLQQPPPPSSPKFDSTKVRRSQGEKDLRRQICSGLNIPSRRDSCKSTFNKSENNVHIIQPKVDAYYSNEDERENQQSQFYRLSLGQGSSSKSLVPGGIPSGRPSRSNSNNSGINQQYVNKMRTSSPERKHKIYIMTGFASLLVIAIACVIISLSIAPHIDSQVRQQNQELIRGIQKITSTSNTTNGYNNSSFSSTTPSSPFPPLIEDPDEINDNNNYNSNINPGQSLTRNLITIEPGLEEYSGGKRARIKVLNGGTVASKDRPLSSSLIGAVLLRNNVEFEDSSSTRSPSNINSFSRNNNNNNALEDKDKLFLDDQNEPKNSPTEFKSENSNILLGQISDIDEMEERVRTSIVLR